MVDKIWISVFALLSLIWAACSESSPSGVEADVNVFMDPRDSHEYRIIEIGGRVWMAENLDYYNAEDSLQDRSFCFKDSSVYCEKQGRLYQWNLAMKACPEGWRLPSKVDFDSLIAAVGGYEFAADSLKSLGFISNVQGGYYFMGYFNYFDEYAYFWTRDEVRNLNARSVMLEKGRSSVSFDETYEEFALSVRCVR